MIDNARQTQAHLRRRSRTKHVSRATIRKRHYAPPSPLIAELVALLIRERKRAGMTQQGLARALRRQQSWVSRLENGTRSRLYVDEFLGIADVIGFDAAAMLRKVIDAQQQQQRITEDETCATR
jgi:ribosome-binding protein aMBF1 (putative translation factor)